MDGVDLADRGLLRRDRRSLLVVMTALAIVRPEAERVGVLRHRDDARRPAVHLAARQLPSSISPGSGSSARTCGGLSASRFVYAACGVPLACRRDKAPNSSGRNGRRNARDRNVRPDANGR